MRDELHEPVEPAQADSAKRKAMQHLERAFDDAEAEGVPTDALAHAALFAALTTLVDCFGEDCVARLVSELPDRINAGGYTLSRTIQ
ncbi:hypothetical protein [Chthonobacter albigriseus]|uniref:hypothetical protein n=1 Tax=Chthonobacter albigriseus TaxID=1683161 RepID=UPI0015EE8058|nr:hypothetical protein [Chthonobacter albigriseus]